MRVVAVLTVVGTAIAAAYLLRVLYRLWHGDPDERAAADAAATGPADASGVELAVTVPLVLATTVLGLLPWLLLNLTAPAVDLVLGLGRGIV
jgi:NADH-quinone oxidoreductase subunit M